MDGSQTPEKIKWLCLFMLNTGQFKQVKGTRNYFISDQGFVFITKNARDFVIDHKIDWDSYTVHVKINNVVKNLAYLMAAHFIPYIGMDSKFDYTINKFGYIPLSSIKTDKVIEDFSENDYSLMRMYGCFERANNANVRDKYKITAAEVLYVLVRYDFKCIYCGELLNNKGWHLDHYQPLSRGGNNKVNNLVSSCAICNIMKGALVGDQFYERCKIITDNFLLKIKDDGKDSF